MVDQYYFKRLNLFKLTYKLLLAYHSPLGNTIKLWTSYYMLSHILAIRKDLHILNISITIIQIRKALNAVFHRIRSRGSLLIYAQSFEALKINQGNIFIFVTSWLGGLISNYKQVLLSLSFNRTLMSEFGTAFLKRPQLDALDAIIKNPVLRVRFILFNRQRPKIPPVPTISLSVLDNHVWLNECHNLKIPSIQLCDTRTEYDLVTYPIVSNQRSVPFTSLIVNLFSETCNFAVLYEHLYFLYYEKYHGIKNRLNKTFRTEFLDTISKRRDIRPFRKRRRLKTYLGEIPLINTDQLTKSLIKQTLLHFQQHTTKRWPGDSFYKHTFVFNTKIFSYQIRDFFKLTTKRHKYPSKSLKYSPIRFIQHFLLDFYHLFRNLSRAYFALKKKAYRLYKAFKTETQQYNMIYHNIVGFLLNKNLLYFFKTRKVSPKKYKKKLPYIKIKLKNFKLNAIYNFAFSFYNYWLSIEEKPKDDNSEKERFLTLYSYLTPEVWKHKKYSKFMLKMQQEIDLRLNRIGTRLPRTLNIPKGMYLYDIYNMKREKKLKMMSKILKKKRPNFPYKIVTETYEPYKTVSRIPLKKPYKLSKRPRY